MGFFDGYNLTTSGMSAQRTRINTISSNIANAKTTHTEEGGPYKRKQVVFEEIMMDNSNKDKKTSTMTNDEKKSGLNSYAGVGVKSIIESKEKDIMRYEPNHPDANENGYVAYPNVNPVVEMVDLIEATRSYEANLQAFKTHKTIDDKTIDILKV